MSASTIDFIKQVRAKVTEGTSALFLMTENATIDRVKEAFMPAPRWS